MLQTGDNSWYQLAIPNQVNTIMLNQTWHHDYVGKHVSVIWSLFLNFLHQHLYLLWLLVVQPFNGEDFLTSQLKDSNEVYSEFFTHSDLHKIDHWFSQF